MSARKLQTGPAQASWLIGVMLLSACPDPDEEARRIQSESIAAISANTSAQLQAEMDLSKERLALLQAQSERLDREAEAQCAAGGPCLVPTQGQGEWTTYVSTDPITSLKETRIALTSAASTDTRHHQALNIVCSKQRRTELYFSVENYVGSGGQNLPYKIDEASPGKWWATPSTSVRGLFVSKPAAAAKAITAGKKLVVQYRPYGEAVVSMTFDLTGAELAAKPLAEACKW